jgi:hypothetical protein
MSSQASMYCFAGSELFQKINAGSLVRGLEKVGTEVINGVENLALVIGAIAFKAFDLVKQIPLALMYYLPVS